MYVVAVRGDIGGLGGAARRSQQSLLKQEVSDGLGVSRARTRFHVCPTLVSTKREGVRPRAKGINKNTQKPGIDNRPNEGGNKRRKQVPEMTPRGNNGHVTTQTDTHREVTWRSLMKLIRCEGTLIDPGRPQGLSDWISNRKGRAKTGFLSGFPELEVQAQEQHRGGSSPLCLPSQPAPALKSLKGERRKATREHQANENFHENRDRRRRCPIRRRIKVNGMKTEEDPDTPTTC